MQSLKQDQRLEAFRLRRHNLTYQDILCRLPVAKSTLWRWLKAEGLVETQPQRLTELRRLAQQKGAAVVRQKRIRRTELLIEEGKLEAPSTDNLQAQHLEIPTTGYCGSWFPRALT